MLTYIILAAAVLFFGIIRAFKYRNDLKSFSIALTAAISLAISILAFPYYWNKYQDILISVLTAFRYGVHAIAMNVENDIVKSFDPADSLYTLYHHFMYALYLLGPICASIFLVSFSIMVIEWFKTFRSSKIHIFNSLNEQSILIAESITAKSEKQMIIFCNTGKSTKEALRNRAIKAGSILLPKSEDSIRLRNNKYYEFYVMEENCEKCLSYTSGLCSTLLNKKNYSKDHVTVRCFIGHQAMEYIRKLDSVYGNKVYLRYVDRDNATAIELLRKIQPQLIGRKQYEIVIAGICDTSLAILRNLLFYMNEPYSSCTLHVMGTGIRNTISTLKAECPEIINLEISDYLGDFYIPEKNYDLRFYEASLNDCSLIERLKGITPDIVCVCGPDDKQNYDAAKMIKRELASRSDALEYPSIAVLIRDPELNKIIADENDLIRFGNYRYRYDYDHILNPELEQAAKRIHLAYVSGNYQEALKMSNYKQEKILEETGYYCYANIDSSFAAALMMEKHRAWILTNKTDNVLTDDEFVHQWLQNEENMNRLADTEHNRWSAYTRLQGYRLPNENQQKAIIAKSKGRKAKDDELLLHSALVSNDELGKQELRTDELLTEYNKAETHTRYAQLDKDILNKMNDIFM